MGDRRWSRRGLAVAVAVAAAGLLPAPGQAADSVQVTTSRSTFLPGDDELGAVTLVIAQGVGITLTNTDVFAAHGLTSDDSVAGGARLFESGVLNFRGSARVVGVTSLPPGTYGFHCSVHEDNMHGHLVVL